MIIEKVTNYLHYAIVLRVVRDMQIKLSIECSVYLVFTIISSFRLDLFNILSTVPSKSSFSAEAEAFSADNVLPIGSTFLIRCSLLQFQCI